MDKLFAGTILVFTLSIGGCAFTPSTVPVGYVLPGEKPQLDAVHIVITSDDIPDSKLLNFQYSKRVRVDHDIRDMLRNTRVFTEISLPDIAAEYSLVIDYRKTILNSEEVSNKTLISSATLFLIPVKAKTLYAMRVRVFRYKNFVRQYYFYNLVTETHTAFNNPIALENDEVRHLLDRFVEQLYEDNVIPRIRESAQTRNTG